MAIIYHTAEPKAPLVKTPDIGPRKGKGEMAEAELQRLVQGLVASAKQYTDGELSPKRAAATKLYAAESLGNEEVGRSQFVSSDVRDGVRAMIPPIMRAVLGPERVVEFRPRNAATVDEADQATDYVNFVFLEDNAGFLRCLDVLKDGFVRKLGVFKWLWDDTTSEKTYKQEGLTQAQLELLEADDDVEIVSIVPDDVPAGAEPTSTVEVTVTVDDGRVRIYALPPEEFVYNREARSIDDAVFVAHVTEKTHGELIAMGIDPKIVKEHGGPVNAGRSNNVEAIERNPGAVGGGEGDDAGDANVKTRYVESFPYIDYNGDGKAELRRVCAIGEECFVVDNEPVDERPFSVFCPDPEPHTLTGYSWADLVGNIQRAKSMTVRGMFDSLAASIYPRTWFREGYANLADVLNTAIGAPIRVKTGANDIGEFGHTFVGKEALPVLGYLDDVIERSTGQNKGAQALDADSFQSTEKAAAQAVITASQAQQELLVRIFVETALKPMFRGILRMLVQHQPRARVVRLRGKYAEVDPRSWDAEMDVSVNVTLGMGFLDQHAAVLEGIAAKQAELISNFGPINPMTNVKLYRDTIAELIVLRGRKDPSRYFTEVDLEQIKAQQEQAAQQPPPPSPDMMLAQVEQMKAQAHIQVEQMKVMASKQESEMKLQMQMAEDERAHLRELEKQRLEFDLRQQEMKLEDDRQRDKVAAEIALKRIELELTTGVQISQQQMDAEIERERMVTQSAPGESQPTADGAPTAKARRRQVMVHRDDAGRIVGATVEDLEGGE